MPDRSNQLDYILSNSPSCNTNVEHTLWNNSDHKPLVSTVTLLSKPLSKHGKAIPVLRLLPTIRPNQLKKIFEDSSWPNQPFIEVAQKLKLAKIKYMNIDSTTGLRKAIRKLEDDSNVARIVKNT